MSDKKTVLGSRALGILRERRRNGTLGEVLTDWKWILGYTRRYRWAVALYALLGILSASLGILSAVADKYTIDIITGYETSKLAAVLAVMIGSSLLSLGLSSLISYVSARISLRIHTDIQAEIFSSVLEADWLSASRYASGDLLSRFNGDIGTVAGNAISWLPDLGIGLYTFAATFLVIWHYDRIMALLALASAPFLLLSSKRLLEKLRQHNRSMKELGSDLMTCEAETFYNLDTVKSLGLTERCSEKLRDRQERFRKASLSYNGFQIRTNAMLSVLGTAVQMGAFCYCLYLLWTGKIVYGTMTLFLSQGARLSATFNKLVGTVPTFLSGSVSAHRIRELQQLEKEPSPALPAGFETNAKTGLSVCARGLSFSYGERQVLSQVSFHAAPGEIVALIGPSGEGKTTLLRLMLGLVRPDEGELLLAPSSGSAQSANAGLRQFFSYVPQGNTVLSGTVAENLRMVKEEASDAELEEALRLACAWDFVSQLPEGIHSKVGERGRGLSEGQAQRLVIARAILRDAPVLLLDEATSALDPATERQVLRNLMHSSPARTCILTTHRPSVLGLCQRIYQVSGGQLRELTAEEASRAAENY